MSHIFISYSRKDTEYAHTLADSLQRMGLSVWIDARIDYGSQWPHEIQKYLDSCEAFILIMSPHAFASDWVQSELQRAKRKRKPIFPLLLEGDEPWLSVESTQFYDVRDRKLPVEEFYSDLRQVVSARETAQTPLPSSTANRRTRKRTVGILMALGVLAALGVCLVLGAFLTQRVIDNRSPTFISGGLDATPPAEKTMTAVVSLPVELPEGSEVTMFSPTGSRVRYMILSAQRESLSPDQYLLRLRIRVWTDFLGGVNFWSDSFRLVAGDSILAPVNFLNEVAERNETVDEDVEFEIDSSLQQATLLITVGRIPEEWATKELRLVFP